MQFAGTYPQVAEKYVEEYMKFLRFIKPENIAHFDPNCIFFPKRPDGLALYTSEIKELLVEFLLPAKPTLSPLESIQLLKKQLLIFKNIHMQVQVEALRKQTLGA